MLRLFKEFWASRLLLACIASAVLSPLSIAQAQQQQAPTAQQIPIIRQITVSGNERIEPETIASYLAVQAGDPFDGTALDQSPEKSFCHRTVF